MAVTKKSSSSKRRSTSSSSASSKSGSGSKTRSSRSSGRKYGPKAQDSVKKEMREYKRGEARSGPGGKGGKVKSREQAIAIGLSKARKQGAKVPSKKAA